MSDSYGLEMQGEYRAEQVSSVPTWTSDDEGRLIWDNSTKCLYYGNDQEWVLLDEEIVGTVKIYAGLVSDIPPGYLICDGRGLLSTDYPRLYAKIGTTWGHGHPPSTDFNLPELRGYYPCGSGSGRPVGERGVGSHDISHTHTIDTQAAHSHSISGSGDHTHSVSGTTGDRTPPSYSSGHSNYQLSSHAHDISVISSSNGDHNHGGSTDSVDAHSHGGVTGSGGGTIFPIPPYSVVCFIIKY